MTKNRDRKRIIRARMAATGEPYSVARRALAGGRPGYWRTSWWHSGWTRLLPVQATFLEIAVTTVTVHDDQVTLDRAIELNPARRDLPAGLLTELTWISHDDDAETAALRTDARRSFERALDAQGLNVPTTVAELAHTLAELGVFKRIADSDDRIVWSSPEALPDPLEVLPLDEAWRDREEHVRWRTTTSMPAEMLCRELHASGRPEHIDTSIENLAATYDHNYDQIHDALDGLLYRSEATVVRQGRQLGRRDLRDLPHHARFRLELDWTAIGTFDPEDGDIDLSRVRWLATPWAIYRSIASDPRIDPGTVRVAGELPFRVVKPTGSRLLTSLGELATSFSMSIAKAADTLVELERAGLVSWDEGTQQAFLYEPGSRRGDAAKLAGSVIDLTLPGAAT